MRKIGLIMKYWISSIRDEKHVSAFITTGDVEDFDRAKRLRDQINIKSNDAKAQVVLDRLEEHRNNPNKFRKCINKLLKVKGMVQHIKLVDDTSGKSLAENETADYSLESNAEKAVLKLSRSVL